MKGKNMASVIRRAEEKDMEGINRLLLEVLLVHHAGRPDLFKGAGKKYTDEQLLAIIRDDLNPVFVSVDENGYVEGHCFCQTQMHPETAGTYEYKSLYIDDLCVEEKLHGKKIGTRIYEYVKKYAKENGYYNVTLHAWECNPNAVAFYKALGMGTQQYTMEEIL